MPRPSPFSFEHNNNNNNNNNTHIVRGAQCINLLIMQQVDLLKHLLMTEINKDFSSHRAVS
jgi:hypothetical protein